MDFNSAVSERYTYLKDEEVDRLVKKAKSLCVEQLYPANLSININTFNWENPRYEQWILDCVDELIERMGMSSVVAYKENGISWSFDRAGVSQALLDRLPRIAHSVGDRR